MKKIALTIAIVLGLGLTTFADPNGGMFQRGETVEQTREGGPNLPGHGGSGNEPAPLGTGIAVLVGLGAAYAMSKRKEED